MAFIVFGMSIYVWIAIVSLIFLIILAALGGYGFDLDGDVDADLDLDYGEFTGPGISPLSLPIVAGFGTTFGAVGALLERANLPDYAVAVGAIFSGVLMAAGLFFAMQRFLVRAQATSDVRPQALVGRDAQVLIPIRGGAQGQILVITEERGRSLFPAVSAEDVPRDAVVEILGFAGGVANVRKKVG